MFYKRIQGYILSNGKWHFESVLTGKYEGMKMNGSGAWHVKGETLIYTSGDNSGKSQIAIKNGILKLNPDPVVLFNGTEPLTGIYSKE